VKIKGSVGKTVGILWKYCRGNNECEVKDNNALLDNTNIMTEIY
jgi:hypothetical protein